MHKCDSPAAPGVAAMAVVLVLSLGLGPRLASGSDNMTSKSLDEHAPAANSKAEAERGKDVFPLPEIAVQARRIEAPASLVIRTVSSEDIEARNAHTVGEALTYVPGVNVQIGGTSGDARAWIRGYRDRDVLVLFDGIPIASGFEGTIDLNEIAVQRVTDINVMKSAPSVIYGTNGAGGVIDVVPSVLPDGSFFDGRAELGTDDRRFIQASGGGGNGNYGFAISAQHQQADDYSLSDDYEGELNQPPGDRINSDFKRDSVFLQAGMADWMLGDTSLFINMGEDEKGLAVETGVDGPDYQRLTESSRRTVGLSNHFRGIPLSAKLFYNGYDSELTTYTDDSYSVVDEVESAKDYSWGGKLYSTLEASSNNTLVLSAGGQVEVFEGEGDLQNRSKADLTTWTLAVEDQFWITQRLSLAVGGILAWFDQASPERSSTEFNPQAAVAWQVSDRLSFHGSAAQRTRFPKLRELYRRRYGNPALEPQTAENYELGLAYNLGNGWTADASLFHSNIDNLIERSDRDAPYTNFEPVNIDGLETAIGGWWGAKAYTRLAYTWVDAEEELPDGGSRQLRSRPEHTAMAEFRYLFPANITLAMTGIYVSGLYDLDPDDTYMELQSYFLAGLRASWDFAEHYQTYLAVSNLGDTDYLQRIGDPREGRSVMLGLQLEY
jgi:iron complex outermembrane receptor protein